MERSETYYLLPAARQQGRVQNPRYPPLYISVVESSDKLRHDYEKMPEKITHKTKKKTTKFSHHIPLRYYIRCLHDNPLAVQCSQLDQDKPQWR